MKRLISLVILCATVGCATIVKPQMQSVTFQNADPNGVTKVHGPDGLHEIHGSSGQIIMSRSRNDIQLAVECGGNKTPMIAPTKFDMLFGGLGNFVFGGVIGWIVDASGDKAYDIKTPINLSSACHARNISSEAKKK